MLPLSSGQAQDSDDLRAKAQYPIGSLIRLPFDNTLDFGAPDGTAYFLSIQPVIPFTLGNWNLVNRVIAPLISTPGLIEGTRRSRKGFRATVSLASVTSTIRCFCPRPIPVR